MEIARGGQAFSHMRHDSHLKIEVSGSRSSAMRPRLRSGSSRFSYGYLRVTALNRMRCTSVRRMPPRTPLTCLSQSAASQQTRSGLAVLAPHGKAARRSSSIHIPEHDVDRAEDRDDVGDEPALQEPGEDLQVRERRAA